MKDQILNLAKNTIRDYLQTGKIPQIEDYNIDRDSPLLKERAGAFVTLYKDGHLRGCIGTIEPVRENLAEEIIYNAISSSTEDPRFPPVSLDELDEISYSVDVLKRPEKVKSLEDLDVKNYGVIVSSGFKKGLLLPNLEGVDTVEEQINIALRKAGISSNEPYKIERFKVVRHEEK